MTRTKKHRKLPRINTDPKGWQKDFLAYVKHVNPALLKTLKDKGCNPNALQYFLSPAQRPDYFRGERQDELDQLKQAFKRVIGQAERCAISLREVREKFFATTFDDTAEFLERAADCFSGVAAELKARKKPVFQGRSVRSTDSLLNIAPLYLYCKTASKDKVTDQEIADFINAGRYAEKYDDGTSPEKLPEALHAMIARAKKERAMWYAGIEQWINAYVVSGAHQRFSFDSWLSEMRRAEINGLRAITENLSIEVAENEKSI